MIRNIRTGICRGLRRPFSFIPCSGSAKDPKPGPRYPCTGSGNRIACEITFPRLWVIVMITSVDKFQPFSKIPSSLFPPLDIPTKVNWIPLSANPASILWMLKSRREQEVAFLLAKLVGKIF